MKRLPTLTLIAAALVSLCSAARSQTVAEYPRVPNAIMQTMVTDSEGHRFKLDDLRGNVVVLNVWGIWCGPCRAEIPDLVKLAADHKSDKLLVLGLNVGNEDGQPEKMRAIRSFKKKLDVNYGLVQASDEVMLDSFFRATRKQSLPQTMVIGPDGELRAMYTGYGPTVRFARVTVEGILASMTAQ